MSLAGLMFLSLAAGLAAGEEKMVEADGLRVIFSDGAALSQDGGEIVVLRTAASFKELFHQSVEKATVHVRSVDRRDMGEMFHFQERTLPSGRRVIVSQRIANIAEMMVRSRGCQVEGMTFGEKGDYEVKIAGLSGEKFERVLAHELVHVLVRETHGDGANLFLNEGIAEYLAGKQFPSEVQHDRGDSKTSNAVLRPYVEGLDFCRRHASDARFAAFFTEQLNHPVTSSRELEEIWEHADAPSR